MSFAAEEAVKELVTVSAERQEKAIELKRVKSKGDVQQFWDQILKMEKEQGEGLGRVETELGTYRRLLRKGRGDGGGVEKEEMEIEKENERPP
jgi:hypothetical protein